MPFSAYLDQKLLEKVFLGVDFTIANRWVSLHTADPGKDGANEASGAPYARLAADSYTAVDDSGSAKRVRNVGALSFQVPVGTFTHVGLWDAVSGGNFLGGGALSAPAVMAQGDLVIVQANDLVILQD